MGIVWRWKAARNRIGHSRLYTMFIPCSRIYETFTQLSSYELLLCSFTTMSVYKMISLRVIAVLSFRMIFSFGKILSFPKIFSVGINFSFTYEGFIVETNLAV